MIDYFHIKFRELKLSVLGINTGDKMVKFNFEKSNELIEKSYKEVILSLIESCERIPTHAEDVQNDPNSRHVMLYLLLKNHYEKMDSFAEKITKEVSKSDYIKNISESELILSANGRGSFELKTEDKLLCKISLEGRQAEAFEKSPEQWDFEYKFFNKTESYPYIDFFDKKNNDYYANFFKEIEKDYRTATSLDSMIYLRYRLTMNHKNVKYNFDMNENLFIRTIYNLNNDIPFFRKKKEQSSLEYIYDVNKNLLEKLGIKNLNEFNLFFKNFKRNKKFFKSIGLSLDHNYAVLTGDYFSYHLKNKNNEDFYMYFTIKFSIEEIAKSEILTKERKSTGYSVRDYIRNPEEVAEYIKLIDY